MKLFSGSRLALRFGVVAVIAGLCAGRAETQNPSLNPTYGTKTLNAGFTPDPVTVNLTAGGPIKTNLGGVNAFVAQAPDYRFNYKAGNFPLIFHVKAQKDTTLLINLPNGQWVANDDGAGFPNPKLTFAKPQSGQYDIWVGTFGNQNAPATLYITELGGGVPPPPPPPPPGGGGPNPSLNPTYGTRSLNAGFPQDPVTVNLTAGGPLKTNLGGVNAFVAQAPDYRVNYKAGNFPLTFHVKAQQDTTLLINLPNGQWVANDDGAGFPNPMLKFAKPQSGQYDIWVGTFGNQPAPATLFVTELK